MNAIFFSELIIRACVCVCVVKAVLILIQGFLLTVDSIDLSQQAPFA